MIGKSFLRGPLVFVALLFAVSAILRIILHADDALAIVEGMSQSRGDVSDAAQTCAPDYDIDAALAEFKRRDQTLTEREANLVQTEAALAVIKDNIEIQLATLAASEARLNDMISHSNTASKNDLDTLTAVYSAMNPKQAAALFETMDPEFAAGFLGMLDPFVAAEILAGVTPEKAYALSVIVAGRNANAPTQ